MPVKRYMPFSRFELSLVSTQSVSENIRWKLDILFTRECFGSVDAVAVLYIMQQNKPCRII